MASYKALAAVGQAIVNLLADASRTEFVNARFKLTQPADFLVDANPPVAEGASVTLYRINVSTSRRSYPPRQKDDGKHYRPPIPLDLYFLVTPWASDAERQYRLLGWIIRVLEDTPILPATLLNELDQTGKIFSANETAELFLESLPLSELTVIWENLRQLKNLPALSYVVRNVLVESGTALPDETPAQTREFAFAPFPEKP